MKNGSKMTRKISVAVLAGLLTAGTVAPAAFADGHQGNGNGNGKVSEQRGNSENAPHGPERTVEDVSALDSTSFVIDFDKTYPKGLDINRMVDVTVELDDATVLEPALTDYEVSSENRSLVTVEHGNDDLDGLSGTLTVNDFEIDFDYSEADEEPFVLDIFHTNDIHSKIDPLGKISAFINEKGAGADNYLYLDAGDIFSGNAVVDLQDGEPIVALLNEMGLDAMAIGNHEFDYGQEAFAAREEQAEFDWLSANMEVVDPDIAIQQPKPYEIYEIDGVDVGIFGLTQNPPATNPTGIVGIDFHDYVETAEQYSYLQDETDILIALTHIGNRADKHLAENVDFFDVIIGGHSHSRIFEADIVNGTPVVQAGADSLFVGHFNLEFDGTDVTFNDYYLQDVEELTEVNQDVQDMIDAYNAEAEELLQEVVGYTNTGLFRDARYQRDTSLGNFITDAMKDALGADLALTNNGGIRANIDEGDITAADIYTVEPFGNELTEIEITGEDLKDVIEYSFSRSNSIDLQTSGLSYTIYTDEDGAFTDADLYIDGEPVDYNETYTLVTNNFMAAGGSGYDFSAADIIQMEAGYITNAMFQWMDYLMESEGAVDYEDGEGRITIEEAE
ncbi:bifunctional metallophosphatase/5'-nucleotidase [Salipaludibacillus aurantiacus]|uniref:2',3'-cyclic-nucleotide 2'-phosphodiesterase / 3'-nucleotidase / 5'-nucleotidase n=1 Tax=Salipaludibacillus aurantiacus TaxID=1601833 RepID=A0A1H9UA80_9BACI|nr:bifunctional UDP-sugar hydrolase/5'-nucleotidase [Salipaludibacillus aurantiacus]SES06067.1 2',3'-cyclic-nucleotide 2'-phosphodiesterase / 3'-nucleotidase / 5'-nucleotidase [Salipaludibacillus aurantiacus]